MLAVEIDGEEQEIERAIRFIEERGVMVQPIEGADFYRMKVSELESLVS
ncbi:MAG: hypothetical protein ABDH29_07300 [Aquificaceae bacterium]